MSVASAQVPLRHQVLCIVNSITYGGSGGTIATCSTNAAAAQIAIHEIGHSAFGLADEYGGDGTATPAGEPPEPNVTRNTNRVTNKWRALIAATTPMPSQCGYPGAAVFVHDEQQWKRYVADSLIETVLARDVLQMQKISKPALLRHLFVLSASFPAQIFSYNKMLGQLQDAGNTTTLAHYLKLLESAFLVSGLELFSRGQVRKRGSSPKLILWNNALINALSSKTFREAVGDASWWGRLAENAVGAHFSNGLSGTSYTLTYWRDGDKEVDFVVTKGPSIWAIEVKSGRSGKVSGLEAFRSKYRKAKVFVVGDTGIALEKFFSEPPEAWLKV